MKTEAELLQSLKHKAEMLSTSQKLAPLQALHEAQSLLATLKAEVKTKGQDFFFPSNGCYFKALRQPDGSYLTFPLSTKMGHDDVVSGIQLHQGAVIENGNNSFLVTDLKSDVTGITFNVEHLSSTFKTAGSLKVHLCKIGGTQKEITLTCDASTAHALTEKITISGKSYTVESAFASNRNNPVKRFVISEAKG